VAQYSYLPGTDILTGWSSPSGFAVTRAFEPHRDLLTAVSNRYNDATVSAFDYINDALARRTARIDHRGAGVPPAITNAFGYNLRSELTSAALGTNAYAYAFDPIGNRLTADEPEFSAAYSANSLNQYTRVSDSVSSVEFAPEFDADGNQTLLKTATGIWHVTYNAENRPVVFSNDTTMVEMAYDYMGRRFYYRETVGGTVSRYERYLYRNYLQIAAFSLMNSRTNELTNASVLLHTLVWDPTEPVATRPLCLQTVNDQQQTNGYYYSFDQVKNVTELFDGVGQIVATYDYAPFGAVFPISDQAVNVFTFSSEVSDCVLGLNYYNYRHLNSQDGRWINGDPIEEKGSQQLIQKKVLNVSQYLFVSNDGMSTFDALGLTEKPNSREGRVRCTHKCQLQTEGCDMVSILTSVPKECCEEHEYTHLADIMLEGDWCSYDKNGCCVGAGEYANSASY